MTSEERPAAGVTALRLSGITKRFGDFTANNRIDLELQSGEILALLGENGAGKTTLMNILFGHYVPDAGTIELAARSGRLRPLAYGSPHAALAAGVGMVHQHFTLADNLSALDNILLGTEPLFSLRQKRNEARSKLKGLMRSTGLEVELDAPIARLSVGERQRVELLKALYRDIRILILDEPTAVLTPQQSQALFSTLKHLANQGLAIIFISHKLDEVLALSDRIAVLRHGEKVVDRSATGISKAELAQAMVDREIKPPASRPSEPGEIVIELREVIVAPGSNQEPIDAVTMQMRKGEILGIAGVSGNGQRAFANLLSSTLTPDRGEMYLYGDPWPKDAARAIAAGIARIPEDRHRDGVVADMRVWENIALESQNDFSMLLPIAAMRRRAEELRDKFDIRCRTIDATTRLLSGGNMQKLILARVLETNPRLIVASQPTRGLDIGAVTGIHELLLKARGDGAAIVLISEDLDELLSLSDRLAVMYRGRLSYALGREDVDLENLGLMMAGQGFHAA